MQQDFTAALDALRHAERFLPALFGDALERLIETPAPDIAALADKLAAIDPMDLDHHAAVLADARRLAAEVR